MMDRHKLYKQINTFKEKLAQRYYKKGVKEVDEYFYYVNDNDALDKAEFVKFLIMKNYISSEYVTILDLAFGSGNLTSHIVFDNNIKYDHIIYNDFNKNNTNQEIIHYVDSSNITHKDILEDSAYQGDEADLVIINPQIGRGKDGYIDGDILRQKEDGEKEQDLFDRFGEVLQNFLDNGATILFYGKEKDFKSILPQVHFIKYKSKLIDIFVISKTFEENLCFEKEGNSFGKCKDIQSQDEEILSFDDVELEVDDYVKENGKVEAKEEKKIMSDTEPEDKVKFSKTSIGSLDFPYKNILFKGVPGTGKSRAIDNIIENELEIKYKKENILRINIHSASSNADLMQGIGISSEDGQINYAEKQGLIFDLIKRAIFYPYQPFVLVLEEIQENSLNELIGDLIYLIEEDKRANLKALADYKNYDYQELVIKVVQEDSNIHYVEIPYLVSSSTEYRKMILSDNLYIFCTSNYRDDKKVIEDNLLRRFEVIEIYPKNDVASEYAREFFKTLNESIQKTFGDEIHPDRYMIGHAIWKDVDDERNFYRAFLKVVTEFKDIKEIEFETFTKVLKAEIKLPENIDEDIMKKENYYELIDMLQKKIGYGFTD